MFNYAFIDFYPNCCTPEALMNCWGFFLSLVLTWLTSLVSPLWGTHTSGELRPRQGVIETFFFSDLWVHLSWHNKEAIMPASCLTTCCQEWFVFLGQRWHKSWQVTLLAAFKDNRQLLGLQVSMPHLVSQHCRLQSHYSNSLSCFFFQEVEKSLLCRVILLYLLTIRNIF